MVFPKETSSNTILTTTTSPLMSLPGVAGFVLVVLLVVVVDIPRPLQAIPLAPGGINRANFEMRRYCNDSLTDLLISICGDDFNTVFRRNPNNVDGSIKSFASKRLTADDDIYRTISSRANHDCCRRGCTFSELKLYCPRE